MFRSEGTSAGRDLHFDRDERAPDLHKTGHMDAKEIPRSLATHGTFNHALNDQFWLSDDMDPSNLSLDKNPINRLGSLSNPNSHNELLFPGLERLTVEEAVEDFTSNYTWKSGPTRSKLSDEHHSALTCEEPLRSPRVVPPLATIQADSGLLSCVKHPPVMAAEMPNGAKLKESKSYFTEMIDSGEKESVLSDEKTANTNIERPTPSDADASSIITGFNHLQLSRPSELSKSEHLLRDEAIEENAYLTPKEQGSEPCKDFDVALRLGIGSWAEEAHKQYTADPSLLIAISRLPPVLYTKFDKQWLANITRCPGESSQSGHSISRASWSAQSGERQRDPNMIGKAPNDDGSEYESDDAMEGGQPPSFNSSNSTVRVMYFACPFHQYDPQYFSANTLNGITYRTCGSKGFDTVSRMKEHMYRRHVCPIVCRQCGIVFKGLNAQSQLNDHAREPSRNGCENRLQKHILGITALDQDWLKAHKKRGNSQEERWKEIYQKLFPGEFVPSPYYEFPHSYGGIQANASVARNDTPENTSLEGVRNVVRVALDALCQNQMPQSEVEDMIISIIKSRQSTIPLNDESITYERVSSGFDEQVDLTMTPNASNTVWEPAPNAALSTGALNMSNHNSVSETVLPLAWREPPYSTALQPLGAFRGSPYRCLSQSFNIPNRVIDQPSSDLGYNSNIMENPDYTSSYYPEGFSRCSYRPPTQDSQSSLFSSVFSSSDDIQHSVTSNGSLAGSGQNLHARDIFNAADFSWDEYIKYIDMPLPDHGS